MRELKMAEKTRPRRRFFTVDEANARLPLVRAIVADMVALARDVLDRRQRLSSLLEGRKASSGDAYTDELRSMQKTLDRDAERLQEFAQELKDLGVEAKGAVEGLVDFPSQLDGREVCLCWRLGEPEVLYWHELEAGFAGRQPLVISAGVDAGEHPQTGNGEHE
jgi:hypothetical protein